MLGMREDISMPTVNKFMPGAENADGMSPESDGAVGTTMVDLAPDGLPFIPVLGEARYASIGKESHLHVHPGLLEILLCRRGRGIKLDYGGRILPFPPGTVMVARPDVRHTLTATPKSLLSDWICLRLPKSGERLPGFTLGQTRWLAGKLRSLPVTFSANRDLEKSFLRIWRIYRETPRKAPERRLLMRDAAMRLLIDLAEAPGRSDCDSHDARLAELVADIRANPAREWPMEELVSRAAMSVPVLTDRFRRLTGLPPHQFVVSCRIERAKEALERTDTPVWRIAGDAGYATAAHFVCVFRRETGMTPALWRKRHAH